MFNFKTEQSKDRKILTISGELTIHNANELKNILVNSLKGTNHIVLNLENVTDVDLSCLQLLCSAYKAARKVNKLFSLESNCPEAFKKAVYNAGYLRHTGCGLNCNKKCIWPEADK
jgi:anti-anti-sigma factor